MKYIVKFAPIFSIMIILPLTTAYGDEGFWPYEMFPHKQIADAYKVTIDNAVVDKVMRASVRINDTWGSGSFISKTGLILTNRHVLPNSFSPSSSSWYDSFLAKNQAEETPIPNLKVYALESIHDVTKEFENLNGQEIAAKMKTEAAKYSESTKNQCETQEYYSNQKFSVYCFKVFQDVRNVFLPSYSEAWWTTLDHYFRGAEFAVSQFDVAIIRVYENGVPYKSPHFLSFRQTEPKRGEFALASGNPQRLNNNAMAAEVLHHHMENAEVTYPWFKKRLDILEAYGKENPTHLNIVNQLKHAMDMVSFSARVTKNRKNVIENIYANEKKLKDLVFSQPNLESYKNLWERQAEIFNNLNKLDEGIKLLARGSLSPGQLFGFALKISERSESTSEVSATDPTLIDLSRPWPVYLELEKKLLKNGLEELQRAIKPESEDYKMLFSGQTPNQLTDTIFSNLLISDPAERENLFRGGKNLIANSSDSLIQFATKFRKVRDKYAQERKATLKDLPAVRTQFDELIYKIHGEKMYPQNNLRLRVSFGRVISQKSIYKKSVPFRSMIDCSPKAPPSEYRNCDVPENWVKPLEDLGPITRVFQVGAHSVGGSSGSPVVDKRGNLIGVLHTATLYTAGGLAYVEKNRHNEGATPSTLIQTILRKVYKADSLLSEIEFSPNASKNP